MSELSEIDEIKQRIEYERQAEQCVTRESLATIWPHLSNARIEHLNNCARCRNLVINRYLTLYVGPVHDIVYKISSGNAAAEWILSQSQEEMGGSCPFSCNINLSSLSRKQAYHVSGCKKCRRLLTFLSRNGGEFVQRYSAPGELLELVKMNTELDLVRRLVCVSNQHEDLRQEYCGEHCLNSVSIGRDRVILLPWHNEGSEHVKNCLHCKLVLFYSEQARHPGYDHFDTQTWKYFPVYKTANQITIQAHVAGCKRCQKIALSRLAVNVAIDQAALDSFFPWYIPVLSQAIRVVKQFLGDWSNSWRFHFGPDAMFSLKHPWSVWGDRDRLLKITRGTNLSEWEQLYIRGINGEITSEQLEEEFKKRFTKA